MKNAFSAITKTMWAFIALLIVIAGLTGYVLGERGGAASESAVGSGAPSNAPSAKGNNEDTASLAAMAKPGANGTKGDGPKALDDGTYDAKVYGPGGPLEKQEDVYNIHRRSATDPFAVGAIDAPVVISEFSDFECPFCSRFANQTEPAILKD